MTVMRIVSEVVAMVESMCVCPVFITRRDESILEKTYGDTVVHEVQGINEPSWSLVRVTV